MKFLWKAIVMLNLGPLYTRSHDFEIEKIFLICPKLVIDAEIYGLVLAPRLEKGYHHIWEANLQPLG
jgi:hypothetical protein